MEQKQRILQLEDANKRLRHSGAKEGGIPEERILVSLLPPATVATVFYKTRRNTTSLM